MIFLLRSPCNPHWDGDMEARLGLGGMRPVRWAEQAQGQILLFFKVLVFCSGIFCFHFDFLKVLFIFDYWFCFVLPIPIIFCLGDSLMPHSSFDPVKYFQHPHGSFISSVPSKEASGQGQGNGWPGVYTIIVGVPMHVCLWRDSFLWSVSRSLLPSEG